MKPLQDTLTLAAQLREALARCHPDADLADLADPLAALLDHRERNEAAVRVDNPAVLTRLPPVDAPGSYRPLILEGDRLMLARDHYLTQIFLDRCDCLATASLPWVTSVASSREWMDRLFSGIAAGTGTIHWQKVAVALALVRPFCVISGGPGTGKTTTVLRLLAMLCLQCPEAMPRIALAAPTGKAAARMQGSIRINLPGLEQVPGMPRSVLDHLASQEASTLHRLLGYQPGRVDFRHHADNPLEVDVLVVDESSMIDTAMMARLLAACADGTRVILLGDRNQLPPVETGHPFADLCRDFGFSTEVAGQIDKISGERVQECSDVSTEVSLDGGVMLRHSHRFGVDSGIGRLAEAVNQGRVDEARRLLQDSRFADLSGLAVGERGIWASDRQHPLYDLLVQSFSGYLQAVRGQDGDGTDPVTLFDVLGQFVVLCERYAGPLGVERMNTLVERALGVGQEALWYVGRPVIIQKNDYDLNLFNGDVGICVSSTEGLRVAFMNMDGRCRLLSPARLPSHDTAFAMTVHKAQGSEFDKVLLLVDRPFDAGCRSLVYTGITRARKAVCLAFPADTGAPG